MMYLHHKCDIATDKWQSQLTDCKNDSPERETVVEVWTLWDNGATEEAVAERDITVVETEVAWLNSMPLANGFKGSSELQNIKF